MISDDLLACCAFEYARAATAHMALHGVNDQNTHLVGMRAALEFAAQAWQKQPKMQRRILDMCPMCGVNEGQEHKPNCIWPKMDGAWPKKPEGGAE